MSHEIRIPSFINQSSRNVTGGLTDIAQIHWRYRNPGSTRKPGIRSLAGWKDLKDCWKNTFEGKKGTRFHAIRFFELQDFKSKRSNCIHMKHLIASTAWFHEEFFLWISSAPFLSLIGLGIPMLLDLTVSAELWSKTCRFRCIWGFHQWYLSGFAKAKCCNDLFWGHIFGFKEGMGAYRLVAKFQEFCTLRLFFKQADLNLVVATQIFLIFTPISGWLIFFRGVETTNQKSVWHSNTLVHYIIAFCAKE